MIQEAETHREVCRKGTGCANRVRRRRRETWVHVFPANAGIFSSALGRTRTCDLLIRSYTYYVYGCSWKLENALGKPNAVSHRFLLFAPVTVKSLSMTGTSDLPYASLEKALHKLHHLDALLKLQKRLRLNSGYY